MKLLLATTNKGKASELQRVAEEFGIELVVPDKKLQVEEDGSTYFENARKKAVAYSLEFGLPALADDSGLEVEVLDWGPGIYSARYGGPNLSDKERCKYLLEQINHERSKACFKCSVVVFEKDNLLASAKGELLGQTLPELRGEGGFGYDPIIEIDSLGKTLAEITPEKNFEIGFRVNAAREVFSILAKKVL